MSPGRPLVLCYHVVSETWDHPIAVRPATLERQLTSAMRRGWRPARVEDVVAARPRALHVTFDDGYRAVTRAVPVLERLGMTATVFVCTQYAADGRMLDLPPLDRVPAPHSSELATLRWDELREFAERGFEIGSHTRTHPDLRRLSDRELSLELTASREEIESEIGRPCSYLAYPYGQFDRRVRRQVENACYAAAFGIAGVGDVGGRFGIERIEPSRRDGDVQMALKSSAAWPHVTRPLRRLRGTLRRVSWRGAG